MFRTAFKIKTGTKDAMTQAVRKQWVNAFGVAETCDLQVEFGTDNDGVTESEAVCVNEKHHHEEEQV